MEQECQELERFANELKLDYKINYVEDQYKVTQIKGIQISNDHWKLGATVERAKEQLVESYLYDKYQDVEAPRSLYRSLYEGEALFWEARMCFRQVWESLKLETEEIGPFLTELEQEINQDGNINFEGRLDRYVFDRKVKNALKRYRRHPDKFLANEKVKEQKKIEQEKDKELKRLQKIKDTEEQRVKLEKEKEQRRIEKENARIGEQIEFKSMVSVKKKIKR